MIHRLFLILPIACAGFVLLAQPVPTTAEARISGFAGRKALSEASWADGLPFAGIGPTIFSGRVVDLEVNPADPTELFVAYGSGGLWHSRNNATTLTPLFDREAVMTIGDIAVHWPSGTIWVGTGENNSSRSSYAGTGLYKSTDHGKTWMQAGLAESHHIGRIVVHPVNPNIVHVACLGALYSENPNRGVYSTFDGGKTWTHSLAVDGITGAIDLVMDPGNPNTLYAATWERTRRFWNFTESGPGSAIYKSADGGKTWSRITREGSGFPTGPGAGRIGLAAVRTKQGTRIYAVIDNQAARPTKPEDPQVLSKARLEKMSATEFLALDTAKVRRFLSANDFPKKYSADTIYTLMQNGTLTPRTLLDYLHDANSQLFETDVIGPEIYRSDNGGKTWQRTHPNWLNNVFYTYGYYFGQIRVSAANPDKLYLLGVPVLKSDDGGKTWMSIGGDNVHGDHHALWIDPRRTGHLVLGNDGGVNITYDDGQSWIKCNQPAVGQFYAVAVDMAKPYNVYGGLQDNGVWYGPSDYTYSPGWQDNGRYPYQFISGGDGMQVAIDPRDNNTVYTGLQFGHYYRIDKTSGNRTYITPRHDLGEHPHRWNWETPIHLSAHNPDILYMGAERVFRSLDQGDHFQAISGDLTAGGRPGDVASGTLVALTESPLRFGLLYTGSDDGLIHTSPDGGVTWSRITTGLPADLWVSSLQASAHSAGRVYAALNGYRWDHFESYVYRSEDFGKTWIRIALLLPTEPVNVVREDPVNPDLLYFGTDNGLFISLDRGQTVMTIGNLPNAPVHDLVVHSRDHELIVATHGRSLFKADVSDLQKLGPDWQDSLTFLKARFTLTYSDSWGKRDADWMTYASPDLVLPVFSSTGGPATIEIRADGQTVCSFELGTQKGLNYLSVRLAADPASAAAIEAVARTANPRSVRKAVPAEDGNLYLLPATYSIIVRQGSQTSTAVLEIEDPEKKP